ncbi:NAD(P)/FAD-dependent oxidoreductase [Streptomyces sp. NEAU-Y11]|uniref:NAD(P)/FAD-dependent oxidoreductase n=1 Tax=Streptomyces cucumeris TaxID=2962890 RepID=UPI0020C83F5B|nr:NAD(P)/FAD-dependent oxidoreductase [Streptomyces sp. NEAU-Y11]MCP9211937.1 NAD(P)/FAD-dependent oxidoreductase [Streptomyces sp. NEAU-Y11]
MDAHSTAPSKESPADPVSVDILVVGAGPVGLYAAYCAGFRGLSVAVMDSLPEVGGQISALYPEKLIHDVAGFPAVRGRGLVEGLARQAAQFGPRLLLGHQADTLWHAPEGRIAVVSQRGTRVAAGAIVVTAGIGRFVPRPLPAAAHFTGRGVDFFVPDPEVHRGREVVVAGGGDSAVDWALALAPLAGRITLVHRRTAFRAHRAGVRAAAEAGVDIRVNTEIEAVLGGARVDGVRLVDRTSGETEEIPCQSVIAALGFTASLGPLERWGLDIADRRIVVNSRMATSVPGIFAAGDITEYPGKVRLMSVGFGEAATAVANAAVSLDPAADLFPGHSTDDAGQFGNTQEKETGDALRDR